MSTPFFPEVMPIDLRDALCAGRGRNLNLPPQPARDVVQDTSKPDPSDQKEGLPGRSGLRRSSTPLPKPRHDCVRGTRQAWVLGRINDPPANQILRMSAGVPRRQQRSLLLERHYS